MPGFASAGTSCTGAGARSLMLLFMIELLHDFGYHNLRNYMVVYRINKVMQDVYHQ